MTDTNFIGIPVIGEPDRSRSTSVEQISQDQLGELFRAVLAEPSVEAIRWRQYTPYFNDGDVCDFGVYDPWFRIAGTPEDIGEDDDGFVHAGHVAVTGGKETEWREERINGRWNWKAVETGRTFDPNPAADAIQRLSAALDNGSAYHVLEDLFGDHATVTVTRERITVDTYEHD